MLFFVTSSYQALNASCFKTTRQAKTWAVSKSNDTYAQTFHEINRQILATARMMVYNSQLRIATLHICKKVGGNHVPVIETVRLREADRP